MALMFARPPKVPKNVRESLIRDYVTRNHHYQQVWNIVNLFDTVLYPAAGRVLTFEQPVLILWGESDAIYPIAGAAFLQQQPNPYCATKGNESSTIDQEYETEDGKGVD
jgi:hypothetical protein